MRANRSAASSSTDAMLNSSNLLQTAKMLLASILLVSCTTVGLSQKFQGSFDFRWLSDPGNRHRVMQLLSDVSFTDDKGRVWSVPAGTKIDGASIPAALWSFEGSPFVGNYRRASVVHDHFCTLTAATPSEVHWMFYQAMLADGLGWAEARRKYSAVSVYSGFGGGCAKGISTTTDLRSLRTSETFAMSDDLLAALQRNEAMILDNVSGRAAAQTVKVLANVEKPETYDALVEFKLSPSEGNYERLERALDNENTTAEEIRELSTLVNAALPPNFGRSAPPRQ